MAFACILNIPDETLTMHLLWRTLAISNCSAYVKFCSSFGISPTQRPFASAKVGTFFLSKDSIHIGQTLSQPDAKMGPLNSLTRSEILDLAFLVTLSALSKLYFQLQTALPSHKLESIFHKLHNQLLPQNGVFTLPQNEVLKSVTANCHLFC